MPGPWGLVISGSPVVPWGTLRRIDVFTSIQYPELHGPRDAYHSRNWTDKKWYSLFSFCLGLPLPSFPLPALSLLQMGEQLWVCMVLVSWGCYLNSPTLTLAKALAGRGSSVPLRRNLSSASCSRCQEQGWGSQRQVQLFQKVTVTGELAVQVGRPNPTPTPTYARGETAKYVPCLGPFCFWFVECECCSCWPLTMQKA